MAGRAQEKDVRDRILVQIPIAHTGDTMDFQEKGGNPAATAFALLVRCHFKHPGPLCRYRSFKPRAHWCIHDMQQMGDTLNKMFLKDSRHAAIQSSSGNPGNVPLSPGFMERNGSRQKEPILPLAKITGEETGLLKSPCPVEGAGRIVFRINGQQNSLYRGPAEFLEEG